MVVSMQVPVLCECIDTRIGSIITIGGVKPVFIMQLQNEAIPEPLIKYFNCNLSEAGNHSVPHNSDFAKVYRSTIGINPTKRFSKAHQLISHLSGYWFIASYVEAQSRSRKQYLKVTHINPEAPVRNDAWTLDGSLKKAAKNSPFQTTKNGDEMATKWRRNGETMATKWRRNGDGETLDGANSLGLEAVFHPIKTLPNQDKTTNTQGHVLSVALPLTQTSNVFNYYRLANEPTSDYYDRVVDSSFKPET